jgi:hypothetical protein
MHPMERSVLPYLFSVIQWVLEERQPLLTQLPGRSWHHRGASLADFRNIAGAEVLVVAADILVVNRVGADPRAEVAVLVPVALEREAPIAVPLSMSME